ncbi:DUF1857-domain-containing protein [Mycena indigotica]|uniref:DUF1857-domain-containing protein n=1 Tax=Mycena indigotica TaxID=2126181 RepID=A0A8H6RZF2_9AGAR|nr:DUF1857-domain-containing protein [Mycena indigotica]KAF7289821.1 DUF1857-domain-containing protein [Mycena indigotica]
MPPAFAATRPVNPPGASPVITEEQLWKGLEYRARKPQHFAVPMLASAKVTVDDGKKLTRETTFRYASQEVIVETITAYAFTIMYFEANTGKRTTNMISYGPSDELLLTFSFTHGVYGLPEANGEELNAMVGKEIEDTIDVVRQMVRDGKL